MHSNTVQRSSFNVQQYLHCL